MGKRFRWVFSIVCIALLALGFVGIHWVAPYALLQPGRVHLDISPPDYGAASEVVHITTEDGIELVAYWTYPKEKKIRGTLLFVHGVGGCKEHFVPLASKLTESGIASIVFDGRAHGESGGIYCTYGFYEKKDVSAVVDFIEEKQLNVPLGIWGNSLGGAIAIQALENDERIQFGIIESTFTDLPQITFDYKKRYLQGLGIRWVSDYALQRAANIADFVPAQVSPLQSVKNIEQPIFMAHGNKDKNIAFKYGKTLFKNLKSIEKTWYTVEGAGHMNLGAKGGEAYRQAVTIFIEHQLSRSTIQKPQ